MSYRVLVTAPAREKIIEQPRYVAFDCQAPLNALRWLERVFDAAETLADCPRRRGLAPVNEFRA